jgi:hypothetical protein
MGTRWGRCSAAKRAVSKAKHLAVPTAPLKVVERVLHLVYSKAVHWAVAMVGRTD